MRCCTFAAGCPVLRQAEENCLLKAVSEGTMLKSRDVFFKEKDKNECSWK